MPLTFGKGRQTKQNRATTEGRWPLKWRALRLEADLSSASCALPEIYLVTEGNLLYEGATGRQGLHRGSVVISHPGNRHQFKQPQGATMLQILFLPEWLVPEAHLILGSPDLFSLFFAQSWFDYPSDQTSFVFTLQPERFRHAEDDLSLLREEFGRETRDDAMCKASFLRLLLTISAEFGDFWRRSNRVELRSEVWDVVGFMEERIERGAPLRLKEELEPVLGMSIDHFGRVFQKSTGLTLSSYAQRRRLQHAAYHLFTSDESTDKIASKLGFRDTNHLEDEFAEGMGQSPREYRARTRES
ncbi:MAG: helix-turn-helix transcriptional regulator [Verrucomicrobiales bacterium]